jgi:hypothetical protein
VPNLSFHEWEEVLEYEQNTIMYYVLMLGTFMRYLRGGAHGTILLR